METSADFFNIQDQQLSENHNLISGNRLSPYLNESTINLLKNFEKFQQEPKFTFIVDWQTTENL